jgi:hypothetical protein
MRKLVEIPCMNTKGINKASETATIVAGRNFENQMPNGSIVTAQVIHQTPWRIPISRADRFRSSLMNGRKIPKANDANTTLLY